LGTKAVPQAPQDRIGGPIRFSLPPTDRRTITPEAVTAKRSTVATKGTQIVQLVRTVTAAQNDSPPGKTFPRTLRHLPGKNDVADFLRDYAAKFNLRCG
jgi:hypothetical protein